MNDDSLNNTKNKILLLEQEIKTLEQKRRKLQELKKEYYCDYFDKKKENYTLLTDIPKNPTKEKHILYDYSVFNIDEIGKIICYLFRDYEKKELISRRLYNIEMAENKFEMYQVYLPILVIGNPEAIEKGKKNKNNIVIDYKSYAILDEYPTDNPVIWDTFSYSKPYKLSNYGHLLNYNGDLAFNYKNYEFIRELIYSLAYYQKEHNIRLMSSVDTESVYKKIYKK